MFYVVRYYGAGIEDVLACLRPLLEDGDAARAITILERDFLQHNAVGPRRVAEFLVAGRDDTIQADVVGYISGLLRSIRAI